MCYDEGTLQAYLDRELPGRKRWEIEAHIATCSRCAGLVARLQDASLLTDVGLTVLLREINKQGSSTEAAWAWTRLTRDERFGAPADTKGVYTMLSSRLKIALVPLAAAVAVAVALSFAPVRTAMADFLNVFRVDKVNTITITEKDISELRKATNNGGNVDIKNFGKIETSGFGRHAPQETTLDGAKKAADFKLKLPENIEGAGAPHFSAIQGTSTSLTLDVEKANGIIKSFGGKSLLPAGLDGKKFTMTTSAAIMANYPRENATPITIVQSKSPEFVFPAGVDPNVVRDVLLSLPILPDGIRQQLEKINDWQHTLPIPAVEGYTKTEQVKVNGANGVFMTTDKVRNKRINGNNANTLIWQNNGIVYGISGENMGLAQAQAIAASMK